MRCVFCSSDATTSLSRVYLDDGTVGVACPACATEADNRRPVYDDDGEPVEYAPLGRERGSPSPDRLDDADAAAWATYRARVEGAGA